MRDRFETESLDETRMRYVREYAFHNLNMPTYREMQAWFDLSLGGVHKFIKRCIGKGYLTKKGNRLTIANGSNQNIA